MEKVLNDLIKYLESKAREYKIEDYNEHTREHSKGFKKGCEYMIALVKIYTAKIIEWWED